mmetsp:Transcript_29991/g.76374  ORF Transcript_29991/g.76374 Transcript_29991/m.76374 type:complete len:231 (+) Transcript_29991:393-1085(+)
MHQPLTKQCDQPCTIRRSTVSLSIRMISNPSEDEVGDGEVEARALHVPLGAAGRLDGPLHKLEVALHGARRAGLVRARLVHKLGAARCQQRVLADHRLAAYLVHHGARPVPDHPVARHELRGGQHARLARGGRPVLHLVVGGQQGEADAVREQVACARDGRLGGVERGGAHAHAARHRDTHAGRLQREQADGLAGEIFIQRCHLIPTLVQPPPILLKPPQHTILLPCTGI